MHKALSFAHGTSPVGISFAFGASPGVRGESNPEVTHRNFGDREAHPPSPQWGNAVGHSAALLQDGGHTFSSEGSQSPGLARGGGTLRHSHCRDSLPERRSMPEQGCRRPVPHSLLRKIAPTEKLRTPEPPHSPPSLESGLTAPKGFRLDPGRGRKAQRPRG